MIEELFLRSSSNAPALRIGVIVDNLSLPRTFVAVLDHIRASNFAKLKLIIRSAAPPTGLSVPTGEILRASGLIGGGAQFSNVLYRRYERWDMERHLEVAAAIGDEDCGPQIAGVEALRVQPATTGAIDRFSDRDVAACRNYNLDVILQFSLNAIRGDVLGCARYGVWSYIYDDYECYRGGPPGFWELVERAPVSGVTLKALCNDRDGGVVLARSLSPTQMGLSRAANIIGPCRSGEPLVIWKLHQLHMYGWESVVGSSRVDLQACKLEYSIVSPK